MSFAIEERRLLLATPRIGPMVIDRLESVGIDSIASLRQQGVEAAVERVCTALGTVAWANRRSALREALSAALRR